jgi:NitT/TauT family transport system substrate-binding protein
MKSFWCVVFFLVSIGGSSLSFASEKLQIALDWKPEPEFGAFYEAQRLGLFQAAGLQVEILQGGSGQPVTQMIAAQTVPFGIVTADSILINRSQGGKVVALFAVYQDDPHGIMVDPARGIQSIAELFQNPGDIAVSKGLPFVQWLDHKYPNRKAKLVPYSGGVAEFVRRKDYSQQCFIFSEPVAAKRLGKKAQVFLSKDSGFNPYLTVLGAHEDYIKKHPETVKKLVQAVRSGLKSYLKEPEPTNRLMAKLNTSMDLDSFNEASKLHRPFVETEETRKNGLGTMTLERWKNLKDQLLTLKLIKAEVDVSQAFRNH